MDAVSRQSLAFSEAFAAVAKEVRVALGISQYEVAQRAGISSQYVGYIERGKRCPTIDTLARLAIALETTSSELVTRAEKTSTQKKQ